MGHKLECASRVSVYLPDIALFALLRPFFQLCFFRLGPQHLPASYLLLAIALAAYFATSVLEFQYFLPIGSAALAALVSIVLLGGLTAGVLSLYRHQTRIVQTLTALAGAIAVLDVLELAMLVFYPLADDQATVQVLLKLTAIWGVMIQANILRHALSVPFILGVFVSVGFIFVNIVAMRPMFPIAT